MSKGVVIGLGCGFVILCGLVCAGIFGGAGYFAYAKIKEVNAAGEGFLGKIAAGDVAGAYKETTTSLQANQKEAEFVAEVKKLGLDDYQSVTWTHFDVKNEVWSLAGTVTTKKGKTLPIAMSLVQENGGYKVSSISGGTGDKSSDTDEKPPLPSDAELKKLATASLLKFNEAVQAEKFDDFYDSLSDLWKGQTSAVKLKETFQSFIDKEVDIEGIKDVSPTFESKPAIDKEGVLLLKGHYPTKPKRVNFVLKYAYERPDWKLVGIEVNVKD